MRQTMLSAAAALACLALPVTVAPVWACRPDPLARFVLADCVVVGKVTAVEDRPVSVLLHPGGKVWEEHAVVVVAVSERIKGGEGLTHVRVGISARHPLPAGYEGCFSLKQHFREPLFLFVVPQEVPAEKVENVNVGSEVDQYRLWARLLDDPLAGLRSPDARERFLTAAMLIHRYRTPACDRDEDKQPTRPVDAVESRLILEALAETDWETARTYVDVRPKRLFNELNLSERDGWHAEGLRTPLEFETAARKWLKDHSATYRVRAYVRG